MTELKNIVEPFVSLAPNILFSCTKFPKLLESFHKSSIDVTEHNMKVLFDKSAEDYKLDERQVIARQSHHNGFQKGNKRRKGIEKYDFSGVFDVFANTEVRSYLQDFQDEPYMASKADKGLSIINEFIGITLSPDIVKQEALDVENNSPHYWMSIYDRFLISSADMAVAVDLIKAGIIKPTAYVDNKDDFLNDAISLQNHLANISNDLYDITSQLSDYTKFDKAILQKRNF